MEWLPNNRLWSVNMDFFSWEYGPLPITCRPFNSKWNWINSLVCGIFVPFVLLFLKSIFKVSIALNNHNSDSCFESDHDKHQWTFYTVTIPYPLYVKRQSSCQKWVIDSISVMFRYFLFDEIIILLFYFIWQNLWIMFRTSIF